MRIGSTRAARTALREAGIWKRLTGFDIGETDLLPGYDPGADLERRAEVWGFDLVDHTLGTLASFAVGLAETEALAWDERTPDLATRSYEARRFLAGDRIVHWAIPWLIASGREAQARDLLEIGDEMRLAPSLPGTEGLILDEEDSFGPLRCRGGLWSGWAGPSPPPDAPGFWNSLALEHPGTAQLWTDLARRSARTG